MLDPTRPVKIRQDVVVDELRTLWDQGIQVSPTLLGDREGFPKTLNPAENTALWRRSGELTYKGLETMLELPAYQQMGPEERGEEISKFVKSATSIARSEAVASKLGEGVSLGELKASGLLTFDVARVMGLGPVYSDIQEPAKPPKKKK